MPKVFKEVQLFNKCHQACLNEISPVPTCKYQSVEKIKQIIYTPILIEFGNLSMKFENLSERGRENLPH